MSEHHTILGGKVHVYKRPNSSSWQAREGNQILGVWLSCVSGPSSCRIPTMQRLMVHAPNNRTIRNYIIA